MHKPLLLSLVLLATVFAGCSDSGGSSPPDDIKFDDDLKATKDTGLIRGVVVDASITPVEGVLVSLEGQDASVETDEAGRFSFGDLPGGTYFIRAQKPGYFPMQQSIEVVAGVSEPDVVKILMEVDAEFNPYYFESVFTGYIECSTTVLAACSVPNAGSEIACLVTSDVGAPVCLGSLTNDRFLVEYPVDAVPDQVQSEMVWESTQALGTGMDLLHSWDCGGTFLCDHTASGPSPLLLKEDEAGIQDMELGSGTQNLTIRVFSSGTEESSGLAGVALQQEFKIFTHVFYGYLPPEDWRFSNDNTVPTAPA